MVQRRGRRDLRGCKGCREKMLARMKQEAQDAATGQQAGGGAEARPMRIASVITAHNEGRNVYPTCCSLLASILGDQTALRTVVVDDGGSDGCCDFALSDSHVEHTVIKHEEPIGVGRSRNAGCEAALESGAEVVTFHDAHMRFPVGVIERLAARALQSDAIIMSASTGMELSGGFTGYGCRFRWSAAEGIEGKWLLDKPLAEWQKVPCLMGACYAMSHRTIQKLREPTGRLWEDVAGRWGYSEEVLSLKAALLGIPILVSRDLVSRHLYRKENPVPGAGEQKWRNVSFALAALFSPETFDRLMRRCCEQHLSGAVVNELVEKARASASRPWSREDEQRVLEELVEGLPKEMPAVAAVPTKTTGLPKVSCLCATYGRFSMLRQALACFLSQDYENKELIILNNHPVAIRAHIPDVRVYNEPRYATLGDCRNRLLELAEGEYVRTWDDDDLYMPWSLKQGGEHVGDAPAWKPARSWFWHKGRQPELADNVFEAAMIVRADVARKYGYKSGQGDEHEPLSKGIEHEGGCVKDEMGWQASYVYRWGMGLHHASGDLGSGPIEARAKRWKEAHRDTGEGCRLMPVDLTPVWEEFLELIK